nr:hypothetical protein [uncultured Ottowia sp.]
MDLSESDPKSEIECAGMKNQLEAGMVQMISRIFSLACAQA